MAEGLPMIPRVSALAERAQALRIELRTVRMQKFVEHYMTPDEDGRLNGARAARLAGYEASTSNRTAVRLLKIPAVRAAVDAARAELAERGAYTAERMMRELDGAIEHARRTENASAEVRAIEIKGKLTGLLVERVDARVAIGGFVLNVIGLGEREAANG